MDLMTSRTVPNIAEISDAFVNLGAERSTHAAAHLLAALYLKGCALGLQVSPDVFFRNVARLAESAARTKAFQEELFGHGSLGVQIQ